MSIPSLLVVPLLALALALPAAAERRIGGEVDLRGGGQKAIHAFGENLRAYDYVMASEGGEEIFIPVTDVLEIQLLDPDMEYVFDNSKVTPKSGEMIVILRDGTSHHFMKGYFRDKTFAALDPEGNEERVRFADLSRIRFINRRVELLQCPKDEQLYHKPYKYCPLCGTALQPKR